MNLSTRYALIASSLFFLVFGVLLYQFQEEIKPKYREGLESTLVDTAQILSVFASKLTNEDFKESFDVAKNAKFSALINDILKENFSLRVYITDANGVVLYHSHNASEVGKDYSKWRDVFLTLRSKYGARTTRDVQEDPDSTVIYVSQPIIRNGTVAGVLTVGQPQREIHVFIDRWRSELWRVVLYALIIYALLQLIFSKILSKPVAKLITYTKDVVEGKNPTLPKISSGELMSVASSVEKMKESLEGKKYIEEYIQHLTHELKSPTSGILASAELLKSGIDPKDSNRFIENITHESHRLNEIISKLLELASLEHRPALGETQKFNVLELIKEASHKFKNILIEGDGSIEFYGEPFLLKKALENLIQNSVEFSASTSSVRIYFEINKDNQLLIKVIDEGAGIPDYALKRLGEKFYSLPRPETGRKGTGLGLSFVKRIAQLHGGSFSIRNNETGGVIAEMSLGEVLK